MTGVDSGRAPQLPSLLQLLQLLLLVMAPNFAQLLSPCHHQHSHHNMVTVHHTSTLHHRRSSHAAMLHVHNFCMHFDYWLWTVFSICNSRSIHTVFYDSIMWIRYCIHQKIATSERNSSENVVTNMLPMVREGPPLVTATHRPALHLKECKCSAVEM